MIGNVMGNIVNRFHYSIESIKNRYPCKIIKVKNESDLNKNTYIIYQAVTKLNIRESSLKELLEDSLLIEKFHPTDCIKLGFLSATEILIKNKSCSEETKNQYVKLVNGMFKDVKGICNDTKQ